MFIEILYLPSPNWYSKMDTSTQHWDKSFIWCNCASFWKMTFVFFFHFLIKNKSGQGLVHYMQISLEWWAKEFVD
jgi:hypothetical protein